MKTRTPHPIIVAAATAAFGISCTEEQGAESPPPARAGGTETSPAANTDSVIKPDKEANLFVGNFPYSTSESDIRELFSEYGQVVYVKLPVDPQSGRSRGFGAVTFSTSQSADAAVKALDGKDYRGRPLRVSNASQRRSR